MYLDVENVLLEKKVPQTSEGFTGEYLFVQT